jgi:thiosulfate/3-mercaptopyruvate sulfurtransferase
MPFTTLIRTAEYASHLGEPNWAIIDCRFTLGDNKRGRRDYEQAHIPGAVYADLERDLSGPIIPGVTGRHPLPDVDVFARTLGKWGIDSSVQVVAYDDSGGMMAARLWWMLRWLGHTSVAVLDGGWPRWQGDGRPVRDGTETRAPRHFAARPRPELLTDAAEVAALGAASAARLIDARGAERYRGEVEPIDTRAGHIPGAVCAPYAENLQPDGTFLPAAELRARFITVLGDVPATNAIFYCGSGVSAAHNLLAVAHAGLGDARLYAGSWSDWITDPSRPIATGSEPRC